VEGFGRGRGEFADVRCVVEDETINFFKTRFKKPLNSHTLGPRCHSSLLRGDLLKESSP
jgi:hypothetical protein